MYCRLDRCYADASLFSFSSQGGEAPICVSPASISDHSLISVTVNLDLDPSSVIRPKRENGFKLNVSMLKDEDSGDAIKMVSHLTKLCNLVLRPREQWEALIVTWRKMF